MISERVHKIRERHKFISREIPECPLDDQLELFSIRV
jgi:hypothetical protein